MKSDFKTLIKILLWLGGLVYTCMYEHLCHSMHVRPSVLSTMWDPLLELRPSGLVAAAFPYQTAYWSSLVWEVLFLTESSEQKISLRKGHA